MLAVMVPLPEALERVHAAGVLHRDIKPSNIVIRRTARHEDQRPVLIDFGAAKQSVAEHSKSFAPYTEGYAAIEQVGEGSLGPWTDLYAVGAVMWRIVADGNPMFNRPNPVKVESGAGWMPQGRRDPLPPAREIGTGRYSDEILAAVDKRLKLHESNRIRNSTELLGLMMPCGRPTQGPSEPSQPDVSDGERDDVTQGTSRSKLEQGPKTGSSPVRRVWAGLGLAIVAALAAMFAMPERGADEPTVGVDRVAFTIDVQPPEAAAAMLNIPEAYTPGMLLASGSYHIEVSAPGFQTLCRWIEHDGSGEVARCELEPVPDRVIDESSTDRSDPGDRSMPTRMETKQDVKPPPAAAPSPIPSNRRQR